MKWAIKQTSFMGIITEVNNAMPTAIPAYFLTGELPIGHSVRFIILETSTQFFADTLGTYGKSDFIRLTSQEE